MHPQCQTGFSVHLRWSYALVAQMKLQFQQYYSLPLKICMQGFWSLDTQQGQPRWCSLHDWATKGTRKDEHKAVRDRQILSSHWCRQVRLQKECCQGRKKTKGLLHWSFLISPHCWCAFHRQQSNLEVCCRGIATWNSWLKASSAFLHPGKMGCHTTRLTNRSSMYRFYKQVSKLW